MNRRMLFVSVFISLFLFVGVAGCGTTDKKQDQAMENYVIISAGEGDFGFPSPFTRIARGPGYERMSFIFDTLVWKDDTGVIPWLAKKWEYDEKSSSYIFELNNNVYWHDGQQFTAKDVAFTFDYIKDHPYSGGAEIEMIKAVEVIDDFKLKIVLTEPYAPFLAGVAGSLPIIPKHIWEKVDSPEKLQTPAALIGTGPYKLVDYNKEQGTYMYEANQGYFLGTPKAKKVSYITLNPGMAGAALKKGEGNYSPIQLEQIAEFEKAGFTVMTPDYDWIIKMMINHRKEPFSSKDFRQALAYAIDREKIVKIARRGDAETGSPGIVTPDSEFFNSTIPQYKYNPEKAKSLITGLGYQLKGNYFQKDGKTLEIGLLVRAGKGTKNSCTREAELIKQQLENIGIKVNLLSLETKTVDGMVKNWEFDLAVTGHGGLGGDPEFLNRFLLDKSFNSSRYYNNKELSGLIEGQITVLDPQKRKEQILKIQELLADDIPVLPILYNRDYYAHDGKVKFFFNKDGYANGQSPINKSAFLR